MMRFWHLAWAQCVACGQEVLSWWDADLEGRVLVSHDCAAVAVAA